MKRYKINSIQAVYQNSRDKITPPTILMVDDLEAFRKKMKALYRTNKINLDYIDTKINDYDEP